MEDVVTQQVHEEFARRMEDEHKRLSKRIEVVETRQDALDKLVTSMATMEERMTRMGEDMEDVKTDVRSLTNKPAKRWETLVQTVLSVLVGAVLGLVLARLGLG